MNSYKIAICDDNKAQIEFLSAAVLHWGEKRDIHPQIFTFENGESFLFQYTEDKSFDILLLDIEMGQLNGVQLAKTIRRENKEVQIIFITGYMDYISDGYDVEALHYLLKPVSEEKLDTDLSTVDTVIKTGNKMAVSGPRREKGMVSGWYASTRLSSDTAAISAATAKKAPLPPRSFCRSKKCNSSPKVRISSPICALFFLECYNIDRKGKVF